MARTSRRACRRRRQAYRMLRMAYRMLQCWIRRRSSISYVFGYVSQRHDDVCNIVKKHTMSCTMSYVLLARTGKKRMVSYVFWRYRTLYVRCRPKTYDVIYDIVYNVAHTTGKNILTYYNVRRTYDIVYDIVYNICMNRGCLGPIIAHNGLYRPCSTPSPQDSNDQDSAWNLDDERDYADQQSAPPRLLA
jgi:hypothetical protein